MPWPYNEIDVERYPVKGKAAPFRKEDAIPQHVIPASFQLHPDRWLIIAAIRGLNDQAAR